MGLPCVGTAQSFATPLLLTDGSEPYQLARNPRGALAFDSANRLHLTYWAGGSATGPATPSFVYYRNWTPAQGWSAPEEVDAASVADPGDGVTKIGGRHPSLAVAPDDTVWIVWHDHRHAGTTGNFVDNLEIYAVSRPAGGPFDPEIRITETNAATVGDNGWVPRVAVHDDGRVAILWYDFHFNPNRSDLFVKRSDENGSFDLAETMTSMRLTDETERPAGFDEALSVPDFAIDADGNEFAVWSRGFTNNAPLYAATLPDPTAVIPHATAEQLAAATGSYFDPAKVIAAPNGDLWVTYTDRSTNPRNTVALRRPHGASDFDPPIVLLDSTGAHEFALSAVAADDSTLHCTWIERVGSDFTQQSVWYGHYDPVAGAFLVREQVSVTLAEYQRPAIALDVAGEPHIVFEERLSSSSGDVWFVRPAATASAAGWTLYR